MAHHAERVEKANLRHPILMSPYGRIMDGAHRLVKALIEKRKYVWAIKLKEMPDADRKC